MSAFPTSAALLRALPFAAFVAVLALRATLPEPAPGSGAWSLGEALYGVQAGLAAVLLALFWRRYAELARPPRELQYLLVSVAVGLLVIVLWVNLTLPWMRLGEPATRFVPLAADGSLRWDLIALRSAGAALVVPLIEELFWRSLVMRSLDGRNFLEQAPAATSLFALAASSVVFALGHDLWLAGIVAGLAYGWLYMRTGNLWYPVIAHAVSNAALAAYVVHGRHWSFW
jgi:CAAX prenyl protease-like protein